MSLVGGWVGSVIVRMLSSPGNQTAFPIPTTKLRNAAITATIITISITKNAPGKLQGR